MPFSGEGRHGWSIVALPGPRGVRRQLVEPRGPGSVSFDRELAAFIRCNGLLDSWRPDLQRFARTDSLPTTTPASMVRDSPTRWHELRQPTRQLVHRPTSTASLRRTSHVRRPCIYCLTVQLVVCWNAGSHGMSERSTRSCRWRFSERWAFQQTQVGLRDRVRAMGKVVSQIVDGELGPSRPPRREGR